MSKHGCSGNRFSGKNRVTPAPGRRTLKNFLFVKSNLYMHRDFREMQGIRAFSDPASGCNQFWARSLVRSERPAHNRAVVGSNPSGPIHTLAVQGGPDRQIPVQAMFTLPYTLQTHLNSSPARADPGENSCQERNERFSMKRRSHRIRTSAGDILSTDDFTARRSHQE